MAQAPLKRNENIVKFSIDHHSGLLFCWKIRAGLRCGITSDRMIRYTMYFWEHLMQPHFKDEEEILFVPLRDQRVQKAIDQHTQIRQLVKELAVKEEKGAEEKLAQLADLVDIHIRYEERDLFPFLEHKLTAAQLETIKKQMEDSGHLPTKDEFKDEFWVIGKTNHYSL